MEKSVYYMSKLGLLYQKYHRLDSFKQQKYIPLGSGSWMSKIRVPPWLGSDENSLVGCRMPVSLHVSSCGREQWEGASSLMTLIEGTLPLHEDSTLKILFNPNWFSEVSSPNTITWEQRVSNMNFLGGDINIPSLIPYHTWNIKWFSKKKKEFY